MSNVIRRGPGGLASYLPRAFRNGWAVLPVIALVATLAGVTPAEARYRITFEKMEIIDDKEAGSGRWHLNVNFGTYTNLVLISDTNKGSGGSITINRSYTLNSLAYNYTFTAFEFDHHLFGKPTWKNVGTQNTYVTTAGNYNARITGSQGDVRIYFTVERIPDHEWKDRLNQFSEIKDGQRTKYHVVWLESGKHYAFKVQGTSFTPKLSLEKNVVGRQSGEVLVRGTGNLITGISRFTHYIPTSAYYRVVVSTTRAGTMGEYHLTVIANP